MNTEATHDQNASLSTGQRLRAAREELGLSQQVVAERLCLKVSTVRDIEGDSLPSDLAATFLRGYIRSYARLVHIPEEQLLTSQEPVKTSRVASMQGYALGNRRKKRDGWLMSFTWLVLFVVIGLTGAWWWQNHKAQQEEITTMATQSSAELNANSSAGQSVPLTADSAVNAGDNAANDDVQPATPPAEVNTDSSMNNNAADSAPSDSQNTATTPNQTADSVTAAPATPSASPSAVEPAVSAPQAAGSEAPSATRNEAPSVSAAVTSSSQLPVEQAPVAESGALVMNFTADCWLEVSDATGKKLFSGMQRKDATLNLAGQAPYKLKIGAPAAVQIQYQGKPVDLSQFIRNNQVARLTLNAEPSVTQ